MYYTIFAKREENFLAKIDVAPLAGARIEIGRCGRIPYLTAVAPLAGARIEIRNKFLHNIDTFVAPLAGARIEIGINSSYIQSEQSLPSRERGLKCLSPGR